MMTADNDKTYYEILHVQRSAPLAIIKNAYRALMLNLKQHPDLGGDSAHAALINEAYEVLSDDGKRAAYDKLLSSTTAGQHEKTQQYSSNQQDPPDPEPQEPQTPFSEYGAQCMFCLTRYNALSGAVFDCGRCGSPMEPPLLDIVDDNSERAFERVSKNTDLWVSAIVDALPIMGKLHDLSPKGMGFTIDADFPPRRVIKIKCPLFDATASVAHKRQLGSENFYYGAEFLTLRLNSYSGTFVSTKL